MVENKIPWTQDTQKRAGRLLFGACFYDIQYTEQDFEYIERKVKTNKLYRLIMQHKIVINPETPEEKYQNFYNDRVQTFFLIKLLDDPDITANVKKFIQCRMSEKRYYATKNAEYFAKKAEKAKKQKKKKSLGYYDLTLHNFFIESWMETCR